MAGTYQQFDHTGDLGIDVAAATEAELYETCAAAMFEILVGRGSTRPAADKAMGVAAPDREMLLLRWLRELLYLHEVERWVFCEFDVSVNPGEAGYALTGVARGEPLDSERHEVRREIKAVTHHQLAVVPGADGRWRARIVFDI